MFVATLILNALASGAPTSFTAQPIKSIFVLEEGLILNANYSGNTRTNGDDVQIV